MIKNREQIDNENIEDLIYFYNSLSIKKKNKFMKLLKSLKRLLVNNSDL